MYSEYLRSSRSFPVIPLCIPLRFFSNSYQVHILSFHAWKASSSSVLALSFVQSSMCGNCGFGIDRVRGSPKSPVPAANASPSTSSTLVFTRYGTLCAAFAAALAGAAVSALRCSRIHCRCCRVRPRMCMSVQRLVSPRVW